MNKRDAVATKARILETAKMIFSEMGFDGARIDDIADRAGVNKALIYYYFKNKDHLLEHVFEEFLEKVRTLVGDIAKRPDQLHDDKAISSYFETTLAFLDKNEELLRIVMMESLKKNASSPLLLRGSDIWNGEQLQMVFDNFRFPEMTKKKSIQQLMVTEFFTNSMPIVMFVLLNKHVQKQYGIGAEELRRLFITAMRDTHIHHHRHQLPASSNSNSTRGHARPVDTAESADSQPGRRAGAAGKTTGSEGRGKGPRK
jgi:TetR/AcrR family transcriptional regulator